MPQFQYRAKKGPSQIVDGTIEAATVDEAVEKLDAIGLIPVKIGEAATKAAAAHNGPAKTAPATAQLAGSSQGKGGNLFGGIRSQEVTIFGRQLATLIKSGVPILRALQIISEQTANPKFRAVLEHAEAEIRNGGQLSSVLSGYPKLFPPIYLAMVRTGEDSGTLHEALQRVSIYRKRQEEIFSRVRTAMAYPALMAFVGVGTVAFMLTFVIPRLSGLFSTMGGDLPLPTKILMSASAVFQTPYFWGGAAVLGAAAAAFFRSGSAALARFRSQAALKLPIFGDFTMKAEMARFSRTLELLIRSGIPILRALEITTPVLGNAVLRTHFDRAREEVMGGASLGRTLKVTGMFPLFLTNLLSVGEESGHMEEALGEIADFYESETDEAIKVLTALLEPLMILGMGLVVGFIVIAMLLPMFELNMMVK